MNRQELYKMNPMGLKDRNKKRHAQNEVDRFAKRNTLHSKHRNIDLDLIVPDTPAPQTQNLKKNQRTTEEQLIRERLAMLNVWRDKKQQRDAENKKKTKPPFIPAGIAKVKSTGLAFVPANHQFQPPKNVQAITAAQSKPQKITKKTPAINLRTKQPVFSPRITRGKRKLLVEPVATQRSKSKVPLTVKTPLLLGKENAFAFPVVQGFVTSTAHKTPLIKRRFSKKAIAELNVAPSTFFSDDEISPIDYENGSPTVNVVPNELGADITTPPKVSPLAHRYLSPFVSTVRGKGSAKRERQTRESVYKMNKAEKEAHLSPTMLSCIRAADYFTLCLNNETERLRERSNEWKVYQEAHVDTLSEDSNGMIDVAVGQTNLLIEKKFRQFRMLIEQCRAGNSVCTQRVLSKDIEGFWDLLFIQIDNINKRFDNLNAYKKNHWNDPEEEIVSRAVKSVHPNVLKLIEMAKTSRKKHSHKPDECPTKSQCQAKGAVSKTFIGKHRKTVAFVETEITPEKTDDHRLAHGRSSRKKRQTPGNFRSVNSSDSDEHQEPITPRRSIRLRTPKSQNNCMCEKRSLRNVKKRLDDEPTTPTQGSGLRRKR